MSQQLTPMQSLQEKMQEHIRQKFAEIVPEEVWKGLTDKVISEYTEKELPKLINAEMELLCRVKIKQVFQSDGFKDKWDNDLGMSVTSESLSQVIEKSAPKIMVGIVGQMMQNFVNNNRY